MPPRAASAEQATGQTVEQIAAALEEFLADEPRRRAIAAAGRERVRLYSFEALWANIVAELQEQWPTLQERAAARLARPTE